MHIGAKIEAKKAIFCQNEETKKMARPIGIATFFVKLLNC